MQGMNVVGVQFRRAGRIYDFSAGDISFQVGDDVVVETDRGPSLAKVAQVRWMGREKLKDKELKTVLRLANKRDLDETRRLTPEKAIAVAREKVDSLKLKMTVLQADVQFGGNKVIVYFSAPGRVDFRDLVKELASGLKSRVELKQVGARDEAKLVGGLGVCGREFCCSSFLRDFVPVSIKMAKNQNLALNPTKVSGGCGRLLCCLTYENDLYVALRKALPKKKARIFYEEENVHGTMLKGDVLNQTILIETDEGRLMSLPLAKAKVVDKVAPAAKPDPTEEAPSEAEQWAEGLDMDLLTDPAVEGEGGAGAASDSAPAPAPAAAEAAQGDAQAEGGEATDATRKKRRRRRRRRRKSGGSDGGSPGGDAPGSE